MQDRSLSCRNPGAFPLLFLLAAALAAGLLDAGYAYTTHIKLANPQLMANFSGDYSDRGIDADGDGLYDFLSVDVGVNVGFPGEYSVQGSLYDKYGKEVVWSIDHQNLSPGNNTLELDFDGKAIELHGVDGPYMIKDLFLTYGTSDGVMGICDYTGDACNTSYYSSTAFTDPVRTNKEISGSGKGEMLLTVTINRSIPVFSGKYSFDIIGIHIPPFSSPFEVSTAGSVVGYAYAADGIYIPKKPNNFTVSVTGARNLGLGLKKLQGSYENSTSVWTVKSTRTWVTSQTPADEEGRAVAETDLISPGEYHVKIFGEAAENASRVDLTMKMVKKVIMDGRFSLLVNTTGFPAGNYSIGIKAVNGSLGIDDLAVDGFALDN